MEPAVEAVVVTIRLNRPPMNVLSDRLQAELADAAGCITTDAAVRALASSAASADAAGVTLTPWA